MKAVMIEKPWDIKNVEREIPELKEGEALIKVKAVGICGSDIGAFRGTNNLVSYPRIKTASSISSFVGPSISM